MNTDRYTKMVLTVIAVALTVIAFRPLYEPVLAYAETKTSYEHRVTMVVLNNIEDWIYKIASGKCPNEKLCPGGGNHDGVIK